jgi:hypothetical protein
VDHETRATAVDRNGLSAIVVGAALGPPAEGRTSPAVPGL